MSSESTAELIEATGRALCEYGYADPEAVAYFVATMINGSHIRAVAFGEETDRTRQTIEEILTPHLGWTPGSEVAA